MKYSKLLKDAVAFTTGAVYKNEYRLIQQHCHELNIVGAFYHYFRLYFGDQFRPYCIDMEYSRMGNRLLPKEIAVNARDGVCPCCHKEHKRRIRSDFIIHQPGSDKNLFVIEFKGEWSSGCLEWDHRKLCELTKPITSRPDGESYVCGYKLGVSIMLKDSGVGLEWFTNGEKDGDAIEISKKDLILKYESYNCELTKKLKRSGV